MKSKVPSYPLLEQSAFYGKRDVEVRSPDQSRIAENREHFSDHLQWGQCKLCLGNLHLSLNNVHAQNKQVHKMDCVWSATGSELKHLPRVTEVSYLDFLIIYSNQNECFEIIYRILENKSCYFCGSA